MDSVWVVPIDELEAISLHPDLLSNDLVPPNDRSHTVVDLRVVRDGIRTHQSVTIATTSSLAEEFERWCNKIEDNREDPALNLDASSSDMDHLLNQLAAFAPPHRIFEHPITPARIASPKPHHQADEDEPEQVPSQPPRLRQSKRSKREDDVD